MTEQNVLLYQYDLTNGMATKVAKFMTGKDVEAIWHTSLVVYGNEYFFGGGICIGQPKCTPYGIPIKESVFGKTKKTQEEFEKYLKSIDDKYNEQTYHLINNNCNHFTNDICIFLCGKGLPDEILNQHKSLSDTAFGKFILEKVQNLSNKNSQIVPNTIEGKNK
jgi:hypothetical protein